MRAEWVGRSDSRGYQMKSGKKEMPLEVTLPNPPWLRKDGPAARLGVHSVILSTSG